MSTHGSFAERLTALRESAGLSRRELAQVAGVSIPCVWYWEEGVSVPRPHNLDTLSLALNVTPDFLQFGEERIDSVDKEITQAKRRIAAAAGLDPTKVTIWLKH